MLKIGVLESVRDQLLLMSDNVLDDKLDNVQLFRELCRLAGRVDFVVESFKMFDDEVDFIEKKS